jgi:arabinan endo-1,5-alpha-L-arabinosidase
MITECPEKSLRVLLLAVLWISPICAAEPPALLTLEGDIDGVHDPVIIRERGTYYVFSTGGRAGQGIVPIRCSGDMQRWTACGAVFERLPEWAVKEIPGARGAWAPDISFFNGKYHLYYSVSTFGKNESVIALATNRTLDRKDPEYEWVDEGVVVRSRKEDDWNAIDANVAIENRQKMWLVWGSFWGGIKMRRLDSATGKLSAEDTTLYALASRPRTPEIRGSIEAPFLVRRGDYWYLFVSFDFCCRGAKSTYNVVVGRSRGITGPYVDRDGKPMTEGGGTPVIAASTENWRGPGHPAVFRDRGRDYLLFHAYNGVSGRPRLHISTMTWEEGWPRVGQLP